MNTQTGNIAAINLALLACITIAIALSIFPTVSSAAPSPPPPATTATPTGEDLTRLSDAELEQRIQNVTQAPEEARKQPWDSSLVKFLTTEVLVFGIVVIIVMGVLVLNNSSTGEVLRLFTVPMIIVAAVFLVVTGYSKDQITPVTALLGTLAGYILGVQSQKGSTQSSAKPTPQQGKATTPPPP
jgi:cytochrome bd-type quinol oxidase subunit 2